MHEGKKLIRPAKVRHLYHLWPDVAYFLIIICNGLTRGNTKPEIIKQVEQILNFQVPAEGLKLVILLHTQY